MDKFTHHDESATREPVASGSETTSSDSKRAIEHALAEEIPAVEADLIEETVVRIRVHLRDSGAATIKGEIEVGRLVHNVRENAHYGAGAVKKIGRKLGVSTQYLYRLVARANAFSNEEIEHALQVADEAGFLLGPSALDELATVVDDQERRRLLNRVISERMTIRRLRDELRHGPHHAASKVKALALPGVTAHADALLQALASLEELDAVELPAEERNKALSLLGRLSDAIGAVTLRLKGESR